MNEKTIMLVEDNPDDVALTQRALKRANILNKLIVLNDGAAVLDYFFGPGSEKRPFPEVILLDLKLPKVDGLEVLKRLHSHDTTKLLPVIVLTSSKEDKDLIRSYDLGANSYIRKPVNFNQFVEAVKQLGLYWLVLNEAPPSPRR